MPEEEIKQDKPSEDKDEQSKNTSDESKNAEKPAPTKEADKPAPTKEADKPAPTKEADKPAPMKDAEKPAGKDALAKRDKPEKTDAPDKAVKIETAKQEKPNKLDKPEKLEKLPKTETKKTEAAKKPEKPVKTEKTEKPEKPEKPEKSDKPDKLDKSEKSENSDETKGKQRERRTVATDENAPSGPRTEKFSERRKSVQQRVDRRQPVRQGIRREEYRTRSYDSLPARDFNLAEIIDTGNVDLIIRTAEDYARTWSDRPPWVKNKFSTFQIRPIYSKVARLKKGEFTKDSSDELKLLKPLVAFIARRYHDDDLYEFARIVRFSIDQVGEDAKRFINFCKFFDSLLLYFRANGGK
jgi:CRISPR type III-A-associated protein Csm2